MVLIDTSVWISLYRGREKGLGELLWTLAAENQAAICGQVYVEFIGGFRKQEQRKEFTRLFSHYPFIDTDQKAYKLGAEFLADFPQLGAGDAIIGATAVIQKVPLLTLDKDFRVLENQGLELFPI